MRTLLAAALLALAAFPARAEAPTCNPPSCERGALPAGLHWETNDTDPVYADPRAQKGGTLHTYVLAFPLTLRWLGPDANDSTRPYILANEIQLTYFHPNTGRPMPGLATHWAFAPDHKTVYYRLNPKAAWSDGTPVTSYDFAFGLDMLRSKYIVDPWNNNYYTTQIDKVVIVDPHTLAIVAKDKHTHWDLLNNDQVLPEPRQAYVLDDHWVQNYQWKTVPNTGPYQITNVNMGESFTLTRKKDWWGKDLRFFKNRYNVDRIVVTVIRDHEVAWRYFLKGKLDGFPLEETPDLWHDKAVGEPFDKGYIKKLWFYTGRPQDEQGLYLNMDVPLFKDRNVRLGFQYAMDVDKVLKTVLRGDMERLRSNTEGYGAATNRNLPERAYDLKLADKYLRLAGWTQRGPDGIRVKDGQRLTARITYGKPRETDRLVILKEDAAKAGIDLTLQQLDDAAAFKTMLEKKHEIADAGWVAQLEPQYWDNYSGDNAHKPQTNNFCNLDDPALNKLIVEFRAAYEQGRRNVLAREIQKRIYDSACFIPTWKRPYFSIAYWRWLKWPKVPGTKMSDDPIAYDFAEGEAWDGLFWIDQKAEADTLAAEESGRTFPPSTVIDKKYKED